ncbi:DUF4249 domain-containing protein [Crocinitomix sp.]|nr:DUF4249 domain-containing protein [Crocinitomix sp.]
MKKIILNLIILVSVVFVVSCEKVIDVPLNEADREVVIEAVARSYEGESYVKVSRSGSVYDDSGFETISESNVTLTDQDGIVTVFTEDPLNLGTYIAPDFVAIPNNNYNLQVEVGTDVYTASSKSNSLPSLDSLSYLLNVGGFGGFGDDTTFLVFYHYTDNAAETNFYRIRSWVNGKLDNNYYLNDDKLGNGQPVQAPVFGTDARSKDTVLIELMSIDKPTHLYLTTLASNLASGGPFSPAPANPVSNMSDGLGYFGVYMCDTLSIIMP